MLLRTRWSLFAGAMVAGLAPSISLYAGKDHGGWFALGYLASAVLCLVARRPIAAAIAALIACWLPFSYVGWVGLEVVLILPVGIAFCGHRFSKLPNLDQALRALAAFAAFLAAGWTFIRMVGSVTGIPFNMALALIALLVGTMLTICAVLDGRSRVGSAFAIASALGAAALATLLPGLWVVVALHVIAAGLAWRIAAEPQAPRRSEGARPNDA